jgi:hypothetical protein
MSIVGYPENLRREIAPGHVEFAAWGALAIADAITDREIITTYDPAREIVSPLAPDGLPPLGFNLSGCSGMPVILHKAVNGIQRFFPVGLILRGPTGAAPGGAPDDRAALGDLGNFDRIHIRRLHYLQEDGTILQPKPSSSTASSVKGQRIQPKVAANAGRHSRHQHGPTRRHGRLNRQREIAGGTSAQPHRQPERQAVRSAARFSRHATSPAKLFAKRAPLI